MKEFIKETLFWIAEWVEIIGVVIIVFGFTKSLIRYLVSEFRGRFNAPPEAFQEIRCEIGMYILLALDFLIVADIIQTLSELSSQQLIELSTLIILRIAIGYFLGKEIEELMNKETA